MEAPILNSSNQQVGTAALDEGTLGIALVVVIVVGSLMAVVYIWRIIEAAWFEPADESADATAGTIREAPPAMLAMVWLAALANIYFGINTDLTVGVADLAARTLMGGYR